MGDICMKDIKSKKLNIFQNFTQFKLTLALNSDNYQAQGGQLLTRQEYN